MKYDDLLTTGRQMTKKQIEENLRSLAADPRFGAVAVWLENNRDGFQDAACNQTLAADHGKLAHAAGSVHAVRVLIGQLRNVTDPGPAPRGPRRPEEE